MRQRVKTKNGSTQSAEVQLHHIMRSVAEKIHRTLQELNEDSNAIIVAAACELAMVAVVESLRNIWNLMDDFVDFYPTAAKWEILSG